MDLGHFSQPGVIIRGSKRLCSYFSSFTLGSLETFMRGPTIGCYAKKLVDMFYIAICVSMRILQSNNSFYL